MPHPGVTLVCGGGGVWGVAWMTGLAMGLAEGGLDLREAGVFFGTSAGSVVSSQLASGLAPEFLYRRQAEPAQQPPERAPVNDGLNVFIELRNRAWRDDDERLRVVCDLAKETETITPAVRRADIVARLGLGEAKAWPAKPLGLTGVDTETLDLVVFDGKSGVALADAVCASCAVPCVWPPAPINGRLYVDGGVWRTADNADLAEGAKAVLILSPTGSLPPSTEKLAEAVARLKAAGAAVATITPDEASLQTMAPGLLNPAVREPAAKAGRRQGLEAVAAVRALRL
jgi:NTE family protein